jgi:transcriptional regulator with XRE-family HTH domain
MLRGDRFRALRLQNGYTYAEIAAILDIGYSQVNRYETNRIDPSSEVLNRMANLFGVSVDYLMGRTDTPSVDIVELSAEEHAVITALRRGEKLEAIKIIVNQASSDVS